MTTTHHSTQNILKSDSAMHASDTSTEHKTAESEEISQQRGDPSLWTGDVEFDRQRHAMEARVAAIQPLTQLRGLGTFLRTDNRTFEGGKRAFFGDLKTSAAVKMAIGTVLGGAALVGIGPWGAIFGGSVGLYLALRNAVRTDTGTVKINFDGKQRSTRFFKTLQSFERLPEELPGVGVTGPFGDEILIRANAVKVAKSRAKKSAPGSRVPGPVLGQDNLKALFALGEQRRLVADLGERSQLGEAALSMVTPHVALELAELNVDVFIVDAEAPIDTPHHLSISAANGDSTKALEETYHWTDRSVDYALTPMTPEILVSKASAGSAGVPEGMVGLYRDGGRYRQIVSVMNHREAATVGAHQRQSKVSHVELTSTPELADQGAPPSKSLQNISVFNFRDPITAAAAASGMLGGAAVFGAQDPRVLMLGIAIGLVGRVIGEWVSNRPWAVVTRRDIDPNTDHKLDR